MQWASKISKQMWFIRSVAGLLAAYVWLVFKTNSWHRHNWSTLQKYWKEGKPFIICFWHNRSMMQMCFWDSKLPFYMLNSEHRDGQICAHAIGHFGLKNIAGSTSRRGTEALRGILSALKNGSCVGLTPDGPRGPRFTVSPGIIQVARLSGVDIVPCISSTTRRKVLNSWDRFVVALPFGRGAFVIGKPIKAPTSKEESETVRQLLEKELQEAADQADALCGHAPLR